MKEKKTVPHKDRALLDLTSVGKATLADFRLLGVKSVKDLARRNPERLYSELCARKGTLQDPCCKDVLCAAVAQARDPNLPAEQRQWWYWSRLRKAKDAGPLAKAARPSRAAKRAR